MELFYHLERHELKEAKKRLLEISEKHGFVGFVEYDILSTSL